MNPKLTYFSKVTGGKLTGKVSKEIAAAILHFDGRTVEITISKAKKTRSYEQNRYYWGVVVAMVRNGLYEAGWGSLSLIDVHELLVERFLLNEIVNEKTGEVMHKRGSTTQLSTSGMMDYLAEITAWSSEYLGISIPQPNEQVKIEFN